MKNQKLLQKSLWCLLALGMSLVLLSVCQSYNALREILFVLPLWLLSLLGAARSFLGPDWLPFARKIPFRAAKVLFVAAVVLLLGAFAASAVYEARTEDPIMVQYVVENRFQTVQYVLKLTLFYLALLLVEQWGLHKGRALHEIRKTQLWFTVTVVLGLLLWELLSGAQMWYIPLERVDNWNDEEDYMLWWFALLCAALLLPFWLLAARKTVRLFRGDRWLPISSRIPKRVTGLLAVAFLGMTVWQAYAAGELLAFVLDSEVPEHTRAAATGHTFQATIWGIALFWVLVMFVKQIKVQRKAAKGPGVNPDAENP